MNILLRNFSVFKYIKAIPLGLMEIDHVKEGLLKDIESCIIVAEFNHFLGRIYKSKRKSHWS